MHPSTVVIFLRYIEIVGIKGCRLAGCRSCFPVRISQPPHMSHVCSISTLHCADASGSPSLSIFLSQCIQGDSIFTFMSKLVRYFCLIRFDILLDKKLKHLIHCELRKSIMDKLFSKSQQKLLERANVYLSCYLS